MIRQVKLTNYRRHADLTVNFTAGINAIRASNEAGKTTVLEAISYCLFGSSALKETLDDVVTYGLSATKLRVDLVFEHLGVVYTMYRAKSGAELTFGKERVTGQKEVTKFIESIFGTSAAMAGKLMIASQSALRGALDDGPTAAGQMIEQLADFDLLDRVVQEVQTQLPVGDTAPTAARINLLREQMSTELADLTPLQTAAAAAAVTRTTAQQAVTDKESALAELDVDAANQILRDEQALRTNLEARGRKLDQLRAALAAPAVIGPDVSEIEHMRSIVAGEKNVASALAVKAELVRLPEPAQWDQDLASLEAEIATTAANVELRRNNLIKVRSAVRDSESQRRQEASEHELKRQGLLLRLIKESSCSLCGKDLKDVPEVVRINAELDSDIQALDLGWARRKEILEKGIAEVKADDAAEEIAFLEAQNYLNALQAVLADHNKCEVIFARAGENVTLDTSVVPARWTWVGPNGNTDSTGVLRRLEAEAVAATTDLATRAEQQKQVAALSGEQLVDQGRLDALPLFDAQETLELANKAKAELAPLRATLQQQEQAERAAVQALAIAKAQNDAAHAARAQLQVQLTAAEAELAEREANNLLIKKVRAARPVITDRLWNMVLASVSQYTSSMRGEPSQISRGDGGFRINGNPVQGLSGSAKDVLGLAIRVALTKVFLPASPFMILDEAAAACDEERENAMLGLLPTLQFDQIILVTHSDLADATADNLITF